MNEPNNHRQNPDSKSDTSIYRSLFEELPAFVLFIDSSNGAILDANPAACSFYGYTLAELTHKTIFDLSALPLNHTREAVQNIVKGGLKHFRNRHTLANGEIREVEGSIGRHRIGDRIINLAVYNDVTHLVEAERQALKVIEQNFFQVFETASTAFILFRLSDLRFQMVNTAFLDHSGYSRQQILGRTLGELSLFVYEEQFPSWLESLSSGKPVSNVDLDILTNSGILSHVLATFIPVEFRGEMNVLLLMVDPSATQDAYAHLQVTQAQINDIVLGHTLTIKALSAGCNKKLDNLTAFLFSLTHELRDSLTGVIGYSGILQMSPQETLSEMQRKAINAIDDYGRHVHLILNELSEYARLLRGDLSLTFGSYSLEELCQYAIQKIKPIASSRGQYIRFSTQPSHITLRMDQILLHRLFLHLLENASRLTLPNGEFGIQVVGDQNAGIVRLSFWDSGMGLNPLDLPHLFEPFEKLRDYAEVSPMPSGLDLALAKLQAEALSGSLQVSTEHGTGNSFILTLPWNT